MTDRICFILKGGAALGQNLHGMVKKILTQVHPTLQDIEEIRATIPKHCWIKNPWRSMSYAFRDVFVIFTLVAAALYFSNWYFWSLYWVAEGTMFWALFVLGYDCGHGSFSDNPTLNTIVGHILHSSILVPYHGWRSQDSPSEPWKRRKERAMGSAA